MKLINYLKREYPEGEVTQWSNWVTDGYGRYWPNIDAYLDEFHEIALGEAPTAGLIHNIISYWIDWDKVQYDAECNGDINYICNLNLKKDEVNEYGELI